MGDARRAAGKKLRAVARALLGGVDGEPKRGAEIVEQARAWGARESDLKLLAERCRSDAPKQTIVEIEPENADAVGLFAGMRTQWRVASIAFPRGAVLVRTGLDYACLPAVAQGRGIALSSAVLDGLAILEDEGLAIHGARVEALLERS